MPPNDPVNHPSRYNAGSMEVIDAIEGLELGFHAGNVVKYVSRYKHKNGIEDLRKAAWYLNRLIELETKRGPTTEKEHANAFLGKGDTRQPCTVRQATDDNRGDIPAIHSLGNSDTSGQSPELCQQPGDTLAEDDGADSKRSGHPDSVGLGTEGDADGW